MADETENLNINIGSNPSGVEQGTRRASAAIRGTSKEAKELDNAFRRIKAAVDPTFAATEKYNRALADNKRLLSAGKIDRDQYLANAKALKAALDAQVESINRNSAAGRAAAAEAKLQAKQRKQEALEVARQEAAAARQAAAEKRAAAREAAAAVEAAHRREQQSIRLSAQTARQAALEARRLAQTAANPSVRGVAPGSIPTDRSGPQLAYARQRAEEAAARASQRAWDLAAKAAEASSAKAASSLMAQSQRARAQAESYSARAVELARTQASEEGRLAQAAANEIRAAKEQERAAARQAAAEARAAAQSTRAANRQAAAAAREAAEATRNQARAEREAAAAALQLRASIDPAFASQQRYNETMRLATSLLMQGKLQQGEWNRIQQQARIQMELNTRSLGRMNSVYVQLGYQAQDVTASLASGINPLVILAQQGGQTASALSQMGGTVGKVASFMAGPWGAAIIGFTMLIGLLAQANKKAEKTTLDLINVEDVRKSKLKDLTKALEDFNKEQERANTNNREALELDRQRAQAGYAETLKRLNDAKKAVADAQAAVDKASADQAKASGRGLEAAAGATALAQGRLEVARKTLKDAQDAYALARKAQQQVEIRTVTGQAEAAVDPYQAIQNKYQDEQTRLNRIYEQETALLDPVRDRVKVLEAELRLNKGLQAALKAREAAQKALRDAEKKTNPYGEGVSTFKSRGQALQIAGRELQGQGLQVSENPLFGGIKGTHTTDHKNAIDVNLGTGINEAEDAGAKARFDAIARSYQNRGYRVLWNGRIYEPGGDGPGPLIPKKTGSASEQHTNHMHIEAPASIVGKPTGTGSGSQDKKEEQEALQAQLEELEYQQKQAGEANYAEQLRLQDLKIQALRSFYGVENREVIRAQRERLAIERQQNLAILADQRNTIQQELAAEEAADQQQAQLESIDRGRRADNAEFNASVGLVNQRQAILERARLLDEEYQSNVRHEQRLYQLRLKAIQDQLKLDNLPVEQRRQLLNQLAQVELQHNNQASVMYQQYLRDVNSVSNQAAQYNAQQWGEISQTITQSMNTAFQGMWTHSTNFGQAMIQLADQLVYKFFDMGSKMVQNWIASLFTRRAATQASTALETATVTAGQAAQNTAVIAGQASQVAAKTGAAATEQGIIAATTGAKVASEAIKSGAAVTGAATQVSAAAGAGMSEVTTNAAVAAAGAYKSTVVIPFIGPVAAPAAAALALAAVLGFGAMIASARGGQERVPYDGQMTELHKDEMVLPAHIANPLRESLKGRGPRSSDSMMGPAMKAATLAETFAQNGDTNFYYQPTHNNGKDVSLTELLRKEGSAMKKWLYNESRNNRLNVGKRG